MKKGDDIQDRLITFSARIIDVCNSLPRTFAGQHIARQLLRSSTAPAAHHAEARGAESSSDFVHKLKISSKELNESEVWLRIIIASKMLPETKLAGILDECNQLQRIHGASIKTARERSHRS